MVTNTQIMVGGLIVAILGLLLAIIAKPPCQWWNILKDWGLKNSRKKCVELLPYDAEHFTSYFREIISKNPQEIRIFGYTSETLSDYIRYDDRYKNITIKILLRNWIKEKEDEENYNSTIGKGSSRPWKKWENLKIKATEWNHAGDSKVNYKIELKFYDEVPIFKGIIVIYQNKEIEVFLGLYQWILLPPEGGSQFKGDKGAVVHLYSKSNDELERKLVLRTVSQFDRMWNNGITYDNVK